MSSKGKALQRLAESNTCGQIKRFGITGVINTLVDFGLFNLLLFLTGVHTGLMLVFFNMMAAGMATVNSFFMNRSFTFKVKGRPPARQFYRFLLVTVTGVLISSLIVAWLSTVAVKLPIPLYLALNAAKIIAGVLGATWNFVFYRSWVFAETPKTEPALDPGVPDLTSVIIPAYNEAERLPARLIRLGLELKNISPLEILVVDDGSRDQTAELVAHIAKDYYFIRLISHPRNLGKGAAVRTGIMASRGEYLVFTDADETFNGEHIKEVVSRLKRGEQIVIGCRGDGKGERLKGESWRRRFMGRCFNLWARLLLVPGCPDTQCGLKGFSRKAAAELFTRQRLTGFAFDVELLALAQRLGYKVDIYPVHASHCGGSSVNRWLSPVVMACDLLKVKLGLAFNLYGLPGLNTWPELALSAGLFMTALAVRIPWLWQVPRYIDELKEVNLAYLIYLGKAHPLTNVAHDIGPLHNYILAGVFKLLGPGIFWPRLYVAVTAALTVVAVYYLGKRLFDKTTGLVASLLLLGNGMHIMVTHMAWSNCTTPFFFTLALLTLVKAEQEKSGALLALSALLWAVTLQTHSSAIIYVLAALCYVLTPGFRKRSTINLGWYLAGSLLFLCGYANMVYYNLVSRGGSIAFVAHKGYALEKHPSFSSFLTNLGQMLIELMRSIASVYSEHSTLVGYLGEPVFMAAFVLLLVGIWYAGKEPSFLPLFMIAASLLIMPWINRRYTFFLATRYIMPVIIMSLLYVAYGMTSLGRDLARKLKIRRALIPALFLLVLIVVIELMPFYRYCSRIAPSNLSNRVALQIIAMVGNLRPETMVLLDKSLPLENEPLPVLLSLCQRQYQMINEDKKTWQPVMTTDSHSQIVAILSEATYKRLEKSFPVSSVYTFTCRVDFPRHLETPRRIYVIKLDPQ